MKAYKWAMGSFSILLECKKEEAFGIIRHFGAEAKGVTLPRKDGGKVSFYGINPEHKVISPVKMASLIVPGHEIPEIGPEITLALFLDDFRLVNMMEFDRYYFSNKSEHE